MVCGRNILTNLYYFVLRPMTLKRLFLLTLLLVTLTSAQVLSLYAFNKNAGSRFKFGLVNGTKVMAWQNSGKSSSIGSDGGIAMIIISVVLGFQFIITLILYCSIIYTSVKSTTDVNRVANSSTIGDARPAVVPANSNCSIYVGGQREFLHLPEPQINNWMDNPAEPPATASRQLQIHSNLWRIPLSNMTIAKVDIPCTISLTLQILAMLLTMAMGLSFLRFSGQIINPDEYTYVVICSDCVMLLTSLVNPTTFLFASKDFRAAVKNMFNNN